MKNFKYNKSFLAAMIIGIMIVSCEKKEYDPNFELSRQFTSSGFQITEGETNVKIEWAPALFTEGKKVNYTIEVSKTPDFQGTPVYTKVVDTTVVVITNSELPVRQPHYARVKTNSLNSTAESNWVVSPSFMITGEQIFSSLLSEDILDVAVRLKWKDTPGLTKIVITPVGGTATDIILTPGDITALQKIVTNLQPNKAYQAEIFADNLSKGIVSFNTKPSLDAGDVIDLRTISGNPSVLFDTLPNIPSGSIVILKKGETYNITSTLDLNKSVTIGVGYDFSTEPATIFMGSNFNITAGSSIDSIVFRGVTLMSDNYSGKYIFNISRACTIGKIKFQSCKAEIFRGITRLQTAVINVTDFIVENCVIDSISNYGVLTVDNVNCQVENISIRNSTIYKAERIIVSKQNSTAVTIENCTFNEAPSGGNYLINYSTSPTDRVINGITVANCIMGIGKPSGTGSRDVRGIRANASVQVTNTYKTSDYTLVTPPPPPAADDSYPISGLIPYAGTSGGLFQSPEDGNFTIIDANFPGKSTAGDPRWR